MTFVTEHSTRFICHVTQVTCIVVIVITAWGTSLAVFTVCWRIMELNLGSLHQPFGMSELSLGHKLSLEEVNPHLVLAPVLVQVLDLLLEKQVSLLGRRLAVSARWLPGLRKVPAPLVRGAGFLGVPTGKGL
jgi:hypothetical protein